MSWNLAQVFDSNKYSVLSSNDIQNKKFYVTKSRQFIIHELIWPYFSDITINNLLDKKILNKKAYTNTISI